MIKIYIIQQTGDANTQNVSGKCCYLDLMPYSGNQLTRKHVAARGGIYNQILEVKQVKDLKQQKGQREKGTDD